MAEAHIEHGNMHLDTRDEWPSDVAVGTFDIEAHPDKTIGGYPGATGHMLFVCPNGRRCGVLVGPHAVDNAAQKRCSVWQWDGNRERPTLQPSINCRAVDDEGKPTSGCGWHGFITNGEIR